MFLPKNIFFTLLFFYTIIFAVDFSIDGNFHGIFDNLENKYSNEESGTIFGTSSDISFGFLPDKNSTILMGVHLFQTFGDKKNQDFQPLVSYRFQNETNDFLFGSAARLNFIEYHDYIFSKCWQFENPVFEGIYFHQICPILNLQWSVWADWIGFQSKDTREMFLLGNDFDYFLKVGEQSTLNFGWQFLYHHKASRDREFFNDPIEDIGAVVGKIKYEYDGFRSAKITNFETAIRGMLTYDRQREHSSDYYTSFGIEPSAKIDFNRFAFGYSHFFKIYDHSPYPYNLETGDDRFLDNFGQADIIAHFLNSKFAKIEFTLSFIFNDSGVNNRETMLVSVPIKKVWNTTK